uniref:Uncharacterized protein n=1 Tax=Leptobrachium leishanense TaxID=445787 RepID=A0A8C5MCX4_9ANUR
MLGNTTNYTEKYSSMTSATTSATHSSLTSVEYTAGTSARFSPNSTNNTQLLEEWLKLSSWNSSTGAGLDIIPDLQRYTSSIGSFGFNKDEVPLIANILGNITQKAAESNQSFSVATLADILYIANQLFNESSWGPATTTNHDLGPQMLQSFESLLAGLETMNQPINISFENIDFQSLTVPCVRLVNETALELGSDIYVSLSDDASQANFTRSCLANLLSMSYRSLSKYFPNDYEDHRDPGVIYKVSSRIVTNTMFIDNRNHHSANINMTFLCEAQDCQSRAICVFWNFTIGKWSSEGCTTVNNGGVTSCLCGHLTSFSVLLSDILPEGLLNVSILDYITNVGLMISIASLVACISLQMYLLKGNVNLVAYYRHMVILNVSSFLLLSNISFVGASYIKPPQFLRLCVALTFCTHFSLLAFFCWTLVQSIFLFCRLVFVFHHITKKEFMTVSTVLGYVTPMLIAVGTFLYYTPTDDYRRDTVCWLQSKSGASMAFTIPTIVTISLNFLVLIVVIKKLLRKSISEGSGEDEEVVKKLVKAVVFCTPQFGLTWAIGIPLLTNGDSLFLQYLFVLLNPLQGFFIFVFGCLLDKKVMDLVKRRLSKSPAFSSTATTVSTY